MRGSFFQLNASNFMEIELHHRFSGPVTIYQDRQLSEQATLAGYSDLIDTYIVCGFHWR